MSKILYTHEAKTFTNITNIISKSYTRFLKATLFFDSASALLNSCIDQVFCLIFTTIIILRLILYLVYLCPFLDLGLFKSYLCNIFFIFTLIFIAINRITSYIFVHFLEYLLLFLNDNVGEESEKLSNSKSSASECFLSFTSFFVNFSLALLIF